MGIQEQIEIRQRLIDEIEADLIGPRKGATKEERAVEITNRNPKNEYIAGVLFPGNWEVSDEDKEQENAPLRVHRSFKEAKEFVRSLGLKNMQEWNDYCKSGNKPDDIPSTPQNVYKKRKKKE